MLLTARNVDDCWIHQLGYSPLTPVEDLVSLMEYAKRYFQKYTDEPLMRILVRDNQSTLAKALETSQWTQIDTIGIYEKRDLDNIPDYNLPTGIIIREALAEDIDGVINVDRSAFRVGHRVPKSALINHLTNSGSFIAVEAGSERIIGYNYNSLNTNSVAILSGWQPLMETGIGELVQPYCIMLSYGLILFI